MPGENNNGKFVLNGDYVFEVQHKNSDPTLAVLSKEQQELIGFDGKNFSDEELGVVLKLRDTRFAQQSKLNTIENNNNYEAKNGSIGDPNQFVGEDKLSNRRLNMAAYTIDSVVAAYKDEVQFKSENEKMLEGLANEPDKAENHILSPHQTEKMAKKFENYGLLEQCAMKLAVEKSDRRIDTIKDKSKTEIPGLFDENGAFYEDKGISERDNSMTYVKMVYAKAAQMSPKFKETHPNWDKVERFSMESSAKLFDKNEKTAETAETSVKDEMAKLDAEDVLDKAPVKSDAEDQKGFWENLWDSIVKFVERIFGKETEAKAEVKEEISFDNLMTEETGRKAAKTVQPEVSKDKTMEKEIKEPSIGVK